MCSLESSVSTMLFFNFQTTAVQFNLIRAHVVNEGNELADVAAKAGTQKLEVEIVLRQPLQSQKTALAAEAIKKWQTEWDNEETGRPVHQVLPIVSLRRVRTAHYLNHVIRGHDAFLAYFEKFNLRNSRENVCRWCSEPSTNARQIAACSVFRAVKEVVCPGLNPTTLLNLMRVRRGNDRFSNLVKRYLEDPT